MTCTKNKIIGELQEKSLHHFLKCYFEPKEAFHEVSVGTYVADIYKDGNIIEIQTGSFDKLRDKLDYYLKSGFSVRVVYPIAETKFLEVETINGKRYRKSPKRGTIYDSVKELYKIKNYLKDPKITISLVLMDVLEERIETNDSRKGFYKVEAQPIKVNSTVELNENYDYLLFLSGLGHEFTSSDLSKEKKIRKNIASLTMTILKSLGLILVTKKEGRSYVYSRSR